MDPSESPTKYALCWKPCNVRGVLRWRSEPPLFWQLRKSPFAQKHSVRNLGGGALFGWLQAALQGWGTRGVGRRAAWTSCRCLATVASSAPVVSRYPSIAASREGAAQQLPLLPSAVTTRCGPGVRTADPPRQLFRTSHTTTLKNNCNGGTFPHLRVPGTAPGGYTEYPDPLRRCFHQWAAWISTR